MPNDTHPLSASGTNDLSDNAGPGPLDTVPLAAADLPTEVSAELEHDESSPLMHDAHSQPVGVLDLHSVPAPPGSTGEPPPPPAPVQPHVAEPSTTPPAQPALQATQAVVDTAKQATHQATQAVVGTAKQATQQVTAAVQQQAQKITVAPRKAIYRGRRFMAIYGGLVGVAGIMAIMARRYRYFPADVGITRALQKPTSKVYEGLMTAVSQ